MRLRRKGGGVFTLSEFPEMESSSGVQSGLEGGCAEGNYCGSHKEAGGGRQEPINCQIRVTGCVLSA